MSYQITLSLWVLRWLSRARRKAPTMCIWVLLTLHSALQTCDGNNHDKDTDQRPQMDICCFSVVRLTKLPIKH